MTAPSTCQAPGHGYPLATHNVNSPAPCWSAECQQRRGSLSKKTAARTIPSTHASPWSWAPARLSRYKLLSAKNSPAGSCSPLQIPSWPRILLCPPPPALPVSEGHLKTLCKAPTPRSEGQQLLPWHRAFLCRDRICCEFAAVAAPPFCAPCSGGTEGALCHRVWSCFGTLCPRGCLRRATAPRQGRGRSRGADTQGGCRHGASSTPNTPALHSRGCTEPPVLPSPCWGHPPVPSPAHQRGFLCLQAGLSPSPRCPPGFAAPLGAFPPPRLLLAPPQTPLPPPHAASTPRPTVPLGFWGSSLTPRPEQLPL